ncbi:MAG: hypothetical protein E6I76_16975 [Chloroflexi bacterium]|nr:MAG: hypothetical protein E6I76_16975 [Chloroflexota bacterium]
MRGPTHRRSALLPSPAWLLLPAAVLLAAGDTGVTGAMHAPAAAGRSAPPAHTAAARSAAPAARSAPAPRRPPSAPAGRPPASAPEAGAPLAARPVTVLMASVWATAHFLYADFLGTCVACTSTGAAHNGSSGEARGTRILAEEASEGQGPANGYRSGELAALPPNPLLHLALESWSASTSAREARSSGDAQATVLDLGLDKPGMLDVTAARASSDSASSASGSRARTRVDGLTATLGGGAVRLVVLHSEASDHGDGRAQIASVNGIVLLQSGNVVMLPDPIRVPRTVSLLLLHGDSDGATAAAARDGRSQGVVGLSSGWTGGGATSQPEPLH